MSDFLAKPEMDLIVESARQYLITQDFNEAEKILNSAFPIGNDYPPVIGLMGEIKRLQSDFLQAEDYLERAYKLDSDYPPVIKSLGFLYFEQGYYEKANSNLTQYLAVENDDPQTFEIKIAIYSAQRHLKGDPLADYHGVKLFQDHVKILETCEQDVQKSLVRLDNPWVNEIGYYERFHCVVGLSFYKTNLSSLPLGIDTLPSLAYLMLQNMNFLTNVRENLLNLPNLQEIELNTWTPLSLRAQEILHQIEEKNVDILWIPPARRRLHISKKQWIFTLIIGAILVDMLVFLWFASELF